MERACHRCGTTLAPPESFCPNCGAPQLRLDEGTENSGAATEQGQAARPSAPANVLWRQAVLAAILAAIPVGLLTSQALATSFEVYCLWVVGGAIFAVGFYRRRSMASLTLRHGLRLGFVVGVLAAFISTAINGASMLIQRFTLHRGSLIDDQINGLIDQWIQQSRSRMDQGDPQAQAAMQHIFTALRTPDGRAALILAASATIAAAVVFFSLLGGALGARIFSPRRGAAGPV